MNVAYRRLKRKVRFLYMKWGLMAWFIISNGFNLDNANKDADQTLRKIKWDIKNGKL